MNRSQNNESHPPINLSQNADQATQPMQATQSDQPAPFNKVKLVGITGGSGSGKTTIVRKISEIVPDFVFIPQDNYYKSAEYINNTNITAFNFDHPEAFDNELLHEHLTKLKAGQIGRASCRE